MLSLRNDPDHYARTCGEWLRRLRDRRAEAVELVGEPVVVDYERYLQACVDAFTRNHVGLMRVVFERV